MTTADLFERQDLGPFDGDEDRAELERAHLLAGLTEHPGWAVLVALLAEEAEKHERFLLTGRCVDHPDYVARTALIRGLRSAIDTPAVMNKRVHDRQNDNPANKE